MKVPVTSPEFLTQLQYFICMLVQLGLFCWFGSGITMAVSEYNKVLMLLDSSILFIQIHLYFTFNCPTYEIIVLS
ncbi:hypothetical protein NQ314_008331 [Rhamnusium bicolor]|uniref:Uncharacterized protein n=1 Tax=Rhamnusium bicolor TaxID=1586634 RepID=A0AAV8YD08_9CUCU|nr:hypothetical protein NQ314_008331 [Rhamnusium bicolor]